MYFYYENSQYNLILRTFIKKSLKGRGSKCEEKEKDNICNKKGNKQQLNNKVINIYVTISTRIMS